MDIELASRFLGPLFGVAVGRVWPHASRLYRTRLVRQFWRPLGYPNSVQIMIGTFELETLDPAGLVGLGDVLALKELQNEIERSRVGEVDIVVPKMNDASDLIGNSLVLVGGPYSNWVSQWMAEQTECTFQFKDTVSEIGVYQVYDTDRDRKYTPELWDDRGVDYGIVQRLRNPWDPDYTILMLAGTYGFGTWGVSRLLAEQAFLREELVRSDRPFEALVKIEVVGQRILTPQLTEIRELPSVAKSTTSTGG